MKNEIDFWDSVIVYYTVKITSKFLGMFFEASMKTMLFEVEVNV